MEIFMLKNVVFLGLFLMSIAWCEDRPDPIWAMYAIRGFMGECIESGQPEESCDCQVEAYQQYYTYEEFLELDKDIRMGVATRKQLNRLIRIINSCMSQTDESNDYLEEYSRRLRLLNESLDRQKEAVDAERQKRTYCIWNY